MVHLIIHMFNRLVIPYVSLNQYFTPPFYTLYQICKICVSFAVQYIQYPMIYTYQGFLNGENVMFPYVHKQHNADKALSCEMTKYIMHN